MIEEYKKLLNEIRAIDSELKEFKNDLFNVKETTKRVLDEFGSFAKKENIKVLEKYINMWNPIQFIREEDVERIVSKEMDKFATKEDIQKLIKELTTKEDVKRLIRGERFG